MRLYRKAKPLSNNTAASVGNKGVFLINNDIGTANVYVNILNIDNTISGMTFGLGIKPVSPATQSRPHYVIVPFHVRSFSSASNILGYELF
jgi:hypothetical protein